MSKTVMQIIIEHLKAYRLESHNESVDIDKIVERINNEYLEHEKQQIIDAFNTGFKDTGLSYLTGEQYYNLKFKDNEKEKE